MSNKRFNIGLLVANVMDPFSNRVAIGAMEAAENLDANLTIFPAKYIDYDDTSIDSRFEYQYNALISHAAAGKFDYMIACIGTVAYLSDNERKKEILKIFDGTPVLSVSSKLDGYDYIQYDNSSGITNAVNYLAKSKRKHICMMVGDLTNIECVERYEAYKNAVINNGLEYDDIMIMESEISEICDNEAEKLLANNPEADAVLCVNDSIAETICRKVKEIGKRVGQDVAVVGFDDLPFAVKLDPPLASIKADAFDLGYRAVEKAVNYLLGVDDDSHYLETKFIPRASCMTEKSANMPENRIFVGSCDQIAENIVSFVSKNGDDIFKYRSALVFCNYAVSSIEERIIKGPANDNDLKYVCSVIENYFEANHFQDETLLKIITVLDAAANWIKKNTKTAKKDEAADYIKKTLYKKLMISLVSDLNDAHSNAFEQMHVSNLVIRDTLMFSENLQSSYASMLKKLYALNIKNSYLYTLEKPIMYRKRTLFPTDVMWNFKSRQSDKEVFTIPEYEQPILSEMLYKNRYISEHSRHTFIAVDLYSREYQYGMLLCEITSDDFFAFLELTVYQLSAAVKIIELLKKQEVMLNELHVNNLSLENMSKTDELTGIFNRRGFYDETNRLLTIPENQGKSLYVCYADMDNLKLVNDGYGHSEGDFSLKAIANSLTKIFDKDAIIARMSGDEFAVLAFRDSYPDAESLSKQKDKVFDELNYEVSKPYKICISMGIYECKCTNSYDLKEAIDKADGLLYAIKAKRKKEI